MGLHHTSSHSIAHVDHGDGLGQDSADNVGAAQVDE